MRNKKRGFTLIETIIVLALVVVVASLMFSFFGQGFSLYATETESADEQKNMRQVLSDITNKARVTAPELITYDMGVLHVDDNSYTSSGEQIIKNGTVLANGISEFNISIVNNVLEIGVVNTTGSRLTTSLSLAW